MEELSRLLLSALKNVRDADLVLAPRRKTDTIEWTKNVVRAAKTDIEDVTMIEQIEETAIGIETADEVTAVIETDEKTAIAVMMTTRTKGVEIMTEIAVIGLQGATEADQKIG